jgi:hypothetical protein
MLLRNVLYVAQKLKAQGFAEMLDVRFMDCIHPELYKHKATPVGFRNHVKELVPSLLLAIQRRVPQKRGD